MKTKTQVSAVVIAALMATGMTTTAFAQNAGNRAEHRAEMFERLDTNNDGSISAEEFAAGGDRFGQADADGNGILTAEELAAAGQERSERRIARMIERLDTDGDGALSKEEMETRRDSKREPGRMFDRIDADDDGVITEEEFEEAQANFRGGKRGGHRKGHGRGNK